jgi:hypothetical protein
MEPAIRRLRFNQFKVVDSQTGLMDQALYALPRVRSVIRGVWIVSFSAQSSESVCHRQMNRMWGHSRSQSNVVIQIRSPETINALGTQHASDFPEVSFRILHMFQNPIGDTCVYGTVRQRKMQAVENFGICTELVFQHGRIDIKAGDSTDASKRLGCFITRASAYLYDF